METFDYNKALAFLRRQYAQDASLKSLPDDLREAEIFERTLRDIPIHRLQAGDVLAGEFGVAPGDTSFDEPPKPAPSKPAMRWDAPLCKCSVGLNHTTLDFERALKFGLKALAEEAPTEAQRRALLAVCDFADRYAEELGFDVCRRAPAYPAETLAEALQTVLFVNVMGSVAEKSFASPSFGRFDQYLAPYYEKEKDAEKASSLLKEFFQLVNRYGDGAGVINFGGRDAQGNDQFNDFSRLTILVLRELRLPGPLLAVRWHEGMRDEDLALFTVPELLTMGQPSFYGEENARRALAMRGVPQEEIETWCVNSCMGLMIPGREFSDMWAVVFSCLAGLDALMHKGKTYFMEGVELEPPSTVNSIDEIMEYVLRFDRLCLAQMMKTHLELNRQCKWESPFTSALLSGGIPGRDRMHGGTRWHTGAIDLFGMANLADSLVAIDELVFKRRRCTWEELIDVLDTNWEGREELRLEALSCPKYGNGDERVDGLMTTLSNAIADIIMEEGKNPEIQYSPSFHTLNSNVTRGLYTHATPDGRRDGAPLAKNIGPTPGCSHNGISGLMRSATAIDQTRYFGGQGLDVHLDQALFATPEGCKNLRAAICSYFKMGGLELQVNAVDVKELEDAVAHPERHEDLVVRIGGYSMRFNRLSSQHKLELIERFKHSA